MVMTHPPAFHVWKFLMKNMIPINSDLNMHALTFLVVQKSHTVMHTYISKHVSGLLMEKSCFDYPRKVLLSPSQSILD